MKKTINSEELIELGFTKYQSKEIIRQAKEIMVNKGYSLYNNKRLSIAPRDTVAEIIGFSLTKGEEVK